MIQKGQLGGRRLHEFFRLREIAVSRGQLSQQPIVIGDGTLAHASELTRQLGHTVRLLAGFAGDRQSLFGTQQFQVGHGRIAQHIVASGRGGELSRRCLITSDLRLEDRIGQMKVGDQSRH